MLPLDSDTQGALVAPGAVSLFCASFSKTPDMNPPFISISRRPFIQTCFTSSLSASLRGAVGLFFLTDRVQAG